MYTYPPTLTAVLWGYEKELVKLGQKTTAARAFGHLHELLIYGLHSNTPIRCFYDSTTGTATVYKKRPDLT